MSVPPMTDTAQAVTRVEYILRGAGGSEYGQGNTLEQARHMWRVAFKNLPSIRIIKRTTTEEPVP